MSKKYLGYLKKFKNIEQFFFNYNNIYSVFQLLKFELFEKLENIHIYNNEICCSGGFVKYFLCYRVEKLLFFNGEKINEKEKKLSKKIFFDFDNAILLKETEKEFENENEENLDKNDKKDNSNFFGDKLYDENDMKIQMWDFVKQKLEPALFNAINELEMSDD